MGRWDPGTVECFRTFLNARNPRRRQALPVMWGRRIEREVAVDTLSFARVGLAADGSLFVTSSRGLDPALIGHEAKHGDQYALFGGPMFGMLYVREGLRTGGSPCRNVFERWAGLDAGGYTQC
jgi:hypothetical protein